MDPTGGDLAARMLLGTDLHDAQPGIDAVLDAEIGVHLARLQERHRDRPRAERRALLLFALEREQIVTVAYREEVMAARIAALDVPEELRQLLRRALAWVWRDEALHVEWVRGQLRHEHRPIPAALLLGHQLTGLVAGWMSTTRMHPAAGRWVGDRVAQGLVLGAWATRRISGDMARELRHQSFGSYAALNAALERTAERCWLRLAELATSEDERRTMAAIARDEARHRHAFAAIAAILDADDRLRANASATLLAERLGQISTWFLPAERRGAPRSPLGSGAPVAVTTGSEAEGPRPAVAAALEAAGVLEGIEGGSTVAVRTCFMVGYDRADRGNVIDPEVLDEVARVLRAAGAADVAVLESPTVYDRYVANRSVAEVAAYFGYDSDRYRIVDAEADQVACDYPRGLGQTTISRTWLEADHRVVLAKATTDPCEYGHLCLSALNGTGGRVESTVYFGRYTDFRSATMMVLDVAPPDLAVIDAWGPVADGPVGVMGSHRPCFPRRIYCGSDAIATDLAALADMGAPSPHAVPMLAAASQWLGIELEQPDVHGATGRWTGGYRRPDATPWDRLVCRMALPMYTYGGAQGARFVPRFDAEAFPDRGRVRIDIRLSRALAQRVFGLYPPRS